MRPPLQILLVEDDEVDYEMVRRLLSKADLRLNLSHADTAAKARLTLRETAIDCMIVDYGLPDADGVELVEEMNRELGDNAPPTVMLTGAGDERLAVSAMKKGVYDYLAKNYASTDDLEQAILGAISQRASARQEREKALRLEQDAFSDELTGIANRRYFDVVFNEALAADDGAVRPLAVILMDLDGFKAVNERWGMQLATRCYAKQRSGWNAWSVPAISLPGSEATNLSCSSVLTSPTPRSRDWFGVYVSDWPSR